MARIPLIEDRTDDLTEEQLETYDWVVQSRGKMIRPFEVMLHTPTIARHAAELGAQIRFGSTLSDHDRELVIITAAVVHGCAFEWDSHAPLARAAGVRPELIEHLETGASIDLTETESLLIGFVRELCAESTVSSALFAAAREYLGQRGVVELCTTVGYYTMLGYVMGACGAC
jgi:4-carboxymuconolactone decarboxylase